jgi:predicted O-methyltransferase YrrM
MQNFRRMKFLYDTIRRFAVPQSSVALEIGVYKGCSMIFLSKACLARGITRIFGMDLFTGTDSWHQTFDTYQDAQSRIRSYGLSDSITLIRSHSQDYAWSESLDVLHLDADHEYEAVRRDIEKYSPFVTEGGLIVFDDYDVSHPGVREAVHGLLLTGEYEVVAVNCPGPEYGSICLRKCVAAAGGPDGLPE